MQRILSPQLSLIEWNAEMLDRKGMEFLREKHEELKIYEDLWKASIGTDFYSISSKLGAEKVKLSATLFNKEAEDLKDATLFLLNKEILKNPISEETRKLSKIVIASQHGANYFNSVAKNTYYPILFNQSLKNLKGIGDQLAAVTTILGGAAYLTNQILFNYEIPSSISTACKIAIASCIGINAIRNLSLYYQFTENGKQINRMKVLFEKALY